MLNSILKSAALLAVLTPSLVLADELQVKIGGRSDIQYGVRSENKIYSYTNAYEKVNSNTGYQYDRKGVVSDTKVDIEVTAKSKYNLIYGGLIKLNADPGAGANKETTLLNRNMIYIQHEKIGRLELGSTPSAQGIMELDIDNFAIGTYGVNGYTGLWRYGQSYQLSQFGNSIKSAGLYLIAVGATAQGTALTNAADALINKGGADYQFIMYPTLPSNYSGHYYSNSPKVNFFTKPASFLTLGFSYTPNLDSHGSVEGMSLYNGVSSKDERGLPATYRDIFGIAGTLEHTFNNVSMKFMTAFEKGTAKIKEVKQLKAVEVGGMVTFKDYNDLKLGATYGDWYRSLTLKNSIASRKHKQNYWTAGLGQQFQKIGYSLTFMGSVKSGGFETLYTIPALKGVIDSMNSLPLLTDVKSNKLRNMVFDVDYSIASGLKVYTAASKFNAKESTGHINRGKILIVGTRILF